MKEKRRTNSHTWSQRNGNGVVIRTLSSSKGQGESCSHWDRPWQQGGKIRKRGAMIRWSEGRRKDWGRERSFTLRGTRETNGQLQRRTCSLTGGSVT